ncbi:MAG: response regulator, partial [Chitinophagia bacterium]|nr:response regulator [Chitinophagia bacterium]
MKAYVVRVKAYLVRVRAYLVRVRAYLIRMKAYLVCMKAYLSRLKAYRTSLKSRGKAVGTARRPTAQARARSRSVRFGIAPGRTADRNSPPVALPDARAPPASAGLSCVPARQFPPAAHSVLSHNASSPSAMNFLVVDDNRLLNRFLTTFFRDKGHTASALTDGTKVEAWLEKNACDAIILDIGLPKVDGITLIS